MTARHLFALRVVPSLPVRQAAGSAAIAAVLLVWWFLTSGVTPEARTISPSVFPSPMEVIRGFPSLVTDRNLIGGIAASLNRVFLGFGLALLVGIPLGIVAGSFRLIGAAAQPISLFGRTIPVAALLPLTLQMFGIGELQKVMFIFLATAPFVFHDTARAIASVHDRYVDTAQTLGASSADVMAKVLIALALPDIYATIRTMFGIAFGYIMLAEVVDAKAGLGFIMLQSQRRGMPEHLVATLFVISALAYGLDALFRFFQRGLFPYREDHD
ncbi:MAG: putative aliphatic sulfonates transport permease protein SsuC [Gemmatimonadaceae bacterium]|nr:putative aliphatic sulfonates transport permease protein SsuC [Gemmatimonadaceae bacterium]